MSKTRLQAPFEENLTQIPEYTDKRAPDKTHVLIGILKQYSIPFLTCLLLFSALIIWLLHHHDLANSILFIAILLGGIPLIFETVWQLIHREFSVDLIASLAIAGSLWEGQYLAGTIIVLMLSGGKALETFALSRARSSLSSLAARAPRTAHIWNGDQLLDIPAETIYPDMIIVVKPGEIVPADGTIEKGSANFSEADLTGEPLPVRKTEGALVLSGSINLDGLVEIRANKRSAESKYAQILKLVQDAQSRKAPIHRLADRYSVWFTALTITLATLAWLITGERVHALAVLVVATPCPLILATPIAIMSGVDLAARKGIILKSGAAIEVLGEVTIAVFDKTGTLTLGAPEVTSVFLDKQQIDKVGLSLNEREILRLIASIDQLSTHILAKAIVKAAHTRDIQLSPAKGFEEIFGKGVRGYVGKKNGQSSGEMVEVAVGNRTFMKHLGYEIPEHLLNMRQDYVSKGQIASFIVLNGVIVGLVILADTARPELEMLVPRLKQQGIEETVLLTGDNEVVANQIGSRAGVDRIEAKCLPEHKVEIIDEYLRDKKKVLMVGDGINDTPALAAASLGMAVGTQGLTAAADVADAILISENILNIAAAVEIGNRSLHIALQGIWIGMGLSIIAMIFALFGYIPPAVGAILQEGIDVLVIFNALRVRIETHPVSWSK